MLDGLPTEPQSRDARGFPINIGDHVVYACRSGNQADLVYGEVQTMSQDGTRIGVAPINRSIGSHAVWSSGKTGPSTVTAENVMVVLVMPPSSVPTHTELVELAKQQAESGSSRWGVYYRDR